MNKFKSMNYTRVVCEECGIETTIEPGIVFEGLNCNCNVEESKQYKEIKVFTDGENTVEALGVFKNGDIEVKHVVEGTLSYRVPANTFATQYNEVQEDETAETPDNEVQEDETAETPDNEVQEESKQYKEIKVFTDGENTVEALGVFKNGDIEVQEDETAETPATNEEKNSISEGSDPSTTVTLSLEDLKGKTPEEIKEAYNMHELRVLAKASKIRVASQMNEDKLVGKLLARAE